MTITYTNEHDINTLVAAWLVHDDYDSGANLFPDKRVISATTLIKPTKQYVLSQKNKDLVIDLSNLIPSRIGSTIHDSLEKLWSGNYKNSLLKLGYSSEDIDKIIINPTPNEIEEDSIIIYLEQRYFKEIDGIIISGKIDNIVQGELTDFKSTSTYTYVHQKNREKFRLQGSIYRWLRPDLIKYNHIKIQYFFTDWQKSFAKQNPKYPQLRTLSENIDLLSLEETEEYIKNKLKEILYNESVSSEQDMIRCTDDDLWKDSPTYKYYSGTDISGRSQKNFTDFQEAMQHLETKGKGRVVIKESEAKACLYCNAFDICKQKEEYYKTNDPTNEYDTTDTNTSELF